MERFNNQGLVALVEQMTGKIINRDLQRRYDAAVARFDQIVDAVIAARKARTPTPQDVSPRPSFDKLRRRGSKRGRPSVYVSRSA